LIYSKLGRCGRFGWAEAILLENFREKNHNIKWRLDGSEDSSQFGVIFRFYTLEV